MSVVPWIFLKIALWNVALMLCFVGGLPHVVLMSVVLMWHLPELPMSVCIQMSVVPWIF